MALSLSISNPPVIRFQVLQSYAASCLLVIWFPVTCPVWSPNHQSFFFLPKWLTDDTDIHFPLTKQFIIICWQWSYSWSFFDVRQCCSPFHKLFFFPFYLKRNMLLKKQASSNTSTIFLAYTHSFLSLSLSLFHEYIFSLSTHTPTHTDQQNCPKLLEDCATRRRR